jgi:hypothetical protein
MEDGQRLRERVSHLPLLTCEVETHVTYIRKTGIIK